MPRRICLALLRRVFIISWILLFHATAAQHFIDDASTYIKYTGTWLTTVGPDFYFNTTHYTKVKGSTVSLTFRNAVRVRLVGSGITNPAVDASVGIIFDGTSYSVSIATDEQHLRKAIWDSGTTTTLDPNVNHTLTCVKTSADGGDMDLYIDAFVLSLPDGTSVPVSGATSTTTTSLTQTTSILGSSLSMTNVSVAADHSTISSIALDLPVGSNDTTLVTTSPASTASISETITKDTGMSNAAKIGIALGALVFICLCPAIFFLLSRRKRVSDSFTHLSPYPPDDTNPTGCQDAECGEVGRRMLPTPEILQWRRGFDTDATYGLNRASGTSAFTGSIPETSLDVKGPPPYSPRPISPDS
ncbi:hypothetical protein FRC18_002226 [Serendipita sp. 400]|nr:hypothetical protein FRC18_002226 [Serendipita sp. 400]